MSLTHLGIRSVLNKDGSESSIESLEGKYVGFYFSAYWCGPCREFTPQLSQKYKDIIDSGEEFEVVFSSGDGNEEDSIAYFAEMPWKMIPFSHRDVYQALSTKFGVRGIPTLVLIDKDGSILSTEGRDYILDVPLSDIKNKIAEKLVQDQRANQDVLALKERFNLEEYVDGVVVDSRRNVVPTDHFREKIVGLYFGAHWCSQCISFTSQLATKYTELVAQGKAFEIVFVSSDQVEAQAVSYFAEMPWTMLSFSERWKKRILSEFFEVQCIPLLVLIGPDGTPMTKQGREAIMTCAFEQLPSFEERKRQEEFAKGVYELCAYKVPPPPTLPLFQAVVILLDLPVSQENYFQAFKANRLTLVAQIKGYNKSGISAQMIEALVPIITSVKLAFEKLSPFLPVAALCEWVLDLYAHYQSTHTHTHTHGDAICPSPSPTPTHDPKSPPPL